MKNTPSAHRRTLTGATGLVASLLLVLLAGCSSKPPACDSPQASAVAQTIFADEFSRIATASYSDNSDTFEPSDVSRIKTEIDSYAKGLRSASARQCRTATTAMPASSVVRVS